MSGCTTTLNNDCIQFFYFSLCTQQSPETLLGKLSCTLFLAVLQEFKDTTFIGGKSHDFTHQATNELDSWVKTLKNINICVRGWKNRVAQSASIL